MTEEQIRESLELSSHTDLDHEAYPSFVEKMAARDYGWDALSSAWAWYRSGWDARANR